MFFEPTKAATTVAATLNTNKDEAAKTVASAPLETVSSWSMPTQASTFAENTDNLYWFIVALDTFFFVLIIGAVLYFMKKYKRRSKDQKTSSITHNGKIEFLWSAIPSALLLVIFVWGECDFLRQTVPPNDALEVHVAGSKWQWTVTYPNYPDVTLTSNPEEPTVALIVPRDRPVRLTMTSDDVLHSFFIPAFRVKRDVVPGRYTQLWFEATRVGEFNLFCAEYCGDQHSKMTGIVKVMLPELFEAELKRAGKLEQEEGESVADFGKRVYSSRGCGACHSVNGDKKTGPTWKGLWGKSETMTDGSTVTVDMNYLRESILEPNKKVVAGFNASMPSFQGKLKQQHIDALAEYIKTLK